MDSVYSYFLVFMIISSMILGINEGEQMQTEANCPVVKWPLCMFELHESGALLCTGHQTFPLFDPLNIKQVF